MCSVTNSLNNRECNLPLEGSPVIHATSNQLIGILLNSDGCLPTTPVGSFVLHYHNVNQFEAWILAESGAKVNALSAALILSAVLMSLKNLL